MTTTTTIQTLATEAAACFEMARRDDESTFVRTIDGSPEWVGELAQSAHGDMFPDDWRYQKISEALDWIADSADPDDEAGEFADNAVDVYTTHRLRWLASHLDRIGYCDEAAEEFGSSEELGIAERIGLGQYYEASEVYGLVLQALEARLSEVDDDASQV